MGTVADDVVPPPLEVWGRTMAAWYIGQFLHGFNWKRTWYWAPHDARIEAAAAAGYVTLINDDKSWERWQLTEAGVAYLRPLVVLLKLRDEK